MPYLTPDTLPTDSFIRRVLIIPKQLDLIICVNGQLSDLGKPNFWEEYGTATPKECAIAMNIMFKGYMDSTEDYP